MSNKIVVVIGAGASGLIAAGRAAQMGAKVILLEKMESPGKKLLISGNTRCNLSNSHNLENFIPMYGKNGKFLYGAFHHFFRDELVNLLGKYGVTTITGPDGRIFPSSGNAADVAGAFTRYATENGVQLITGEHVTGIETAEGHVTGVSTVSAAYSAGAVVLATGGASYPQTGSTGEGYKIAEQLGHTIIPLRPALVPLVLEENTKIKQLQGLSLHKIKLTSFACNAGEIDIKRIPHRNTGRGLPEYKVRPPIIESRNGDIIFTHYGISGPAALLMSMAIADALASHPVSLNIDLLPESSSVHLEHDLQQQFDEHGSRLLHNVLGSLISDKLTTFILETAGIPQDKKAGQIKAMERQTLAHILKGLSFNVKSTRPLAEAMVTAGGIRLDEIHPGDLQSKLVKGLFFCGEVMDIDADTGGYNLQAAFSTGYLAGESAAKPA